MIICFGALDPNFKYTVPKKEHFSKALYTIDIGQNDIGMGLFTNNSIEAVKASVPNMMEGLKSHIKVITRFLRTLDPKMDFRVRLTILCNALVFRVYTPWGPEHSGYTTPDLSDACLIF